MTRVAPRRLLTAFVLAALASAPLATPAEAHRDGCHRWHSCPSDSGSYVCGDLGYYSECPTSRPDIMPIVADYSAPETPTVGAATSRAGFLSVPVVAETGSRLVVSADDGSVFGRYVATGIRQLLRFRARHGSHDYEVTATDSAGNESTAASFTADVDARRPAAAVVTPQAPGSRGGYTLLTVKGEPDARYSVRVVRNGRPVSSLGRDGSIDATGEARLELLAPNARYTATVRLRDRAGNAAPAVARTFRVAIPRPTLSVEWLSAAASARASFRVRGPALGTGYVRLRAPGAVPVDVPFALGDIGATDVSTTLGDGAWTADATVTDFQRRRATAPGAALVVDTAAPDLTVSSDAGAADRRTVDLAITTSDGTTTVTGLPGGPESFSGAGEHRVRREVDDGRYDISVVAVDSAGNRAVRELQVTVTHPLTVAEAATAIVMLALLVLLGWFGWRRRESLARVYWRLRAAAQHRAAEQAHRTAMAAHAASVVAHRHAHAAFENAHRTWAATSGDLARMTNEADDFNGTDTPLPDGERSRPGERVYATVDAAGLVEHRRRLGYDVPTVVDRGSLVVTNERVVFSGSKRREWLFDQLLDISHIAAGQTMMQVANRQKPSGIDYDSARGTRFRLDLAHAAFRGTRAALAATLRTQAAAHVAAEPRPPAPPAPPPPAPARIDGDQLRAVARAARTPAGTVPGPTPL